MTNNNTAVPMKLSNLPLRPSTLSLLLRRGFTTTMDIEQSKQDGGISNFAAEVNCSIKDAFRIVREVEECQRRLLGDNGGDVNSSSSLQSKNKYGTTTTQSSNSMTAAAILQNTSSSSAASSSDPRHIITFCRTIDSLLGGGFARSEVTELCGIPGIGKTQLGMQLCVDARLPRIYGGVEGEAVYIDTEGSFSPERCYTMAQALVKHVQASAARREQQRLMRQRQQQLTTTATAATTTKSLVPSWFNPNTILNGIHVFRVHDETSQTLTIKHLEQFIKGRQEDCLIQKERQKQQQHQEGQMGEMPIAPIKIVIIDSIAFHYRSSISGADYKARTRSLAEISSFLSHLATAFDIAVVVINQMTTKVGSGSSADVVSTSGGDLNDTTKLVPALGESWAHATTTRLLLDFMPSGVRCCRLVKSPHKAAGTALYDVTENGIRDVPPSSLPRQRNDLTLDASKRPRTNY